MARVEAAGGRLRTTVEGLTEDQVRASCMLPGWTRGHVLAHVTNFSRAALRQLEYALAGELIEFYDGGRPGRAAAIEAAAGRPASALLRDLDAAITELAAGWERLGPSDWDRRTTYRDGTLHDVLLCDWRELEIHTVDLDLGVGPSDWSPEFCAHALDFLAPRTPDGVQLVLTTPNQTRAFGSGEPIEVRGELTDLTAWMAGRTPDRMPASDAALPELGPWP